MSFNQIEGKPNIEYPCPWEYRIIGTSQSKIEEFCKSIANGKKYKLEKSKNQTDKYISLVFTIEVDNEENRDCIFKKIKEQDFVKMVL